MKSNRYLFLALVASMGAPGAVLAGGTTAAVVRPIPPPVTAPVPGGTTIVPGPTLPPRTPPFLDGSPGAPVISPTAPAVSTPVNPAGSTPNNPAGTSPFNPAGPTPGSPNQRTAPVQNQALTAGDHVILGRIGQLLRRNGAMNLQVRYLVQNGFVTMVGSVPTLGAAQQLEALIARVPGVQGVNDQLQVNSAGTTGFFDNTAPALLPNNSPPGVTMPPNNQSQ